MNERQQSQNPDQRPPKDPCEDPNPKPPDEPCPPPKLPCPPPEPETPCPPPKTGKECPDLPPLDPDPCAETDEDDGEEVPAGETPETPEESETAEEDPSDPLKKKLKELKATLKAEQDQLQSLEPLKTSVADITQRIQALEKTIDEKSTSDTSYRDFYRQIEVFKKEIEIFIPTVRCQLKLSPKQITCICKAITTVDKKVDEATAQSKAGRKYVEWLERKYKKAADYLAWVKKWYEFLKSGLQQQITKQRDDLKGLKALADPAKDQCEAWFYLYELDRLLKPAEGSACCWQLDIWISTFLNCWPWENCYKDAWDKFIVLFNDAEANEKRFKSRLDQAKKRAEELDKTAKTTRASAASGS